MTEILISIWFWPFVTCYSIYMFLFFFQIWNSLPGVSCKMCSTAESCRDTTKQPGSLKTHSRTTWMTVESFFLRPDLCLGSVLRQWVDSTSSCSMYNSTRVSVKVVQVIVVLDVKWRRLDWFLMTWKILVTKNQSRCLNFQNSSTHVQHTCMHKFLPSFLVGMITYWVMQTRLQH